MFHPRRAGFVLLALFAQLGCGSQPIDGGAGGAGGAPVGGGAAGGGAAGGGGAASGGGAAVGGGGGAAGGAAPIVSPVGAWAWVPVAGSKCARGATAGIGFNRAAGGEELFLFLQGGGACWNAGTCAPSFAQFGPVCDYGNLCAFNVPGGQQPTAVLVDVADPYPRDGGGAFPSQLAGIAGSVALDRARPGNPFRGASFAWVPYCTGDLHAGNSTAVYPFKPDAFGQTFTRTISFAGAANMELYLARLKATLPNLKRIWLTGASAGGYGATLNFERVRRAFPQAEVHLLDDSGAMIDSVHWVQWRDSWGLQLPVGCADCDAGFPEWNAHLLRTAPATSRMGLLSYERDSVIASFFLGGNGPVAALNPPRDAFAAALRSLLPTYDAQPNARAFVVPGELHVLWGEYGLTLADGGTTAPISSRDGGTDLRQWIDAWATGDAGWPSAR